jgi:hypothetical protein
MLSACSMCLSVSALNFWAILPFLTKVSEICYWRPFQSHTPLIS